MLSHFLKNVSGTYIPLYKAPRSIYTILTPTFKYSLATVIIEVNTMTNTTYTTNKTGFIVFDGRLMSIHNFWIEVMGSRMEGTNSLYCHTVGWANLHSFGTKHGSLNDSEVWNVINSVGARFQLYPSVSADKYNTYNEVDRMVELGAMENGDYQMGDF